MQTRIKALSLAAVALFGLFLAGSAIAQTVNQSYYYPQQYATATQYYGSCPALTYNLTIGSSDYRTGGQVSSLQNFLRSRYGDARVTGGYYGQLTSYYVSRFQSEQGVYPVTGGVGPLTRAAIQRACGGYTPTPAPTPYPINTTTFRLDRNFTLTSGQTGELYRENFTITLNQILTSQYGYGYYYNQEPQSVRITATQGCKSGTYCPYAPSRTFTLKEDDTVSFEGYEVELVSLTATRATFIVTEDNDDNDGDDATIEVTRPTGSETLEQGDELKIAWKSSDEPNDSSVVLDLYKSNGSKVGTIAILDDTDGSYDWGVPEGGAYCTQQFPNGLCGFDLEGDYYIKASLVRGDGMSGGEVLDSDTSSTFEIEEDNERSGTYVCGYTNSIPANPIYCKN